jgi:hypothetical protein
LDTSIKEDREAAKQVAWDETLVYYLEGKDARGKEEAESSKAQRA